MYRGENTQEHRSFPTSPRTFADESDTIAAIATPEGQAGIAVVRLSGSDAVTVAEAVFRPVTAGRLADMAGYTAAYGHFHDEDGRFDDGIALVFRAPHSYTGEDTVELSCHGGRYLTRRLLAAVVTAGAVPAPPGAFTKRAFLHGKLDLAGAEHVMNLISAEGAQAAKAALAAKDGALFRRLEHIRSSLTAAAAVVAAFVDFPDDDIPETSPEMLEAALSEARRQLLSLCDGYAAGQLLLHGIDTVIVGSPNVGKSTLMNLLAGTQRSIVTPRAGTTRDIVETTVRIGGAVLRLADTAGLRDTDDTAEQIGVSMAKKRLEQAALVLAVFDGSAALSPGDRSLAASLAEHPAVIALINKADQPLAFAPEDVASYIPHTLVISAKTGAGATKLADAIGQVTGLAQLDGNLPILANERQLRCVRESLDCIEQARRALAEGYPPDAAGVWIDAAAAPILELTGERVTDAVVDEIFSRFCVGK